MLSLLSVVLVGAQAIGEVASPQVPLHLHIRQGLFVISFLCICHCVCVFVPPQVDQVGLFVSEEVHKEFVLEFGIRDPHLSTADKNERSLLE